MLHLIDLERDSVADQGLLPFGLAHNLAVELDRHAAPVEAQNAQQGPDMEALRHLARLAVDADADFRTLRLV